MLHKFASEASIERGTTDEQAIEDRSEDEIEPQVQIHVWTQFTTRRSAFEQLSPSAAAAGPEAVERLCKFRISRCLTDQSGHNPAEVSRCEQIDAVIHVTQQILPQLTGIGEWHLLDRQGLDGLDDEGFLGGPAPVERVLTGMCSPGNLVHAHAGESLLSQQLQLCIKNGLS